MRTGQENGKAQSNVVELPVAPPPAPEEPVDERRQRITWRKWIAVYNPKPLLQSKYGAAPVLLSLLLSFVTGIETQASSLLLPEIKHDMGLTFFQLAVFNSLTGVLLTFFGLPLGYLVDRVKRIPAVVIGGLVHTAGLALYSFGYTPLAMGAGKVMSGVGGEFEGLPMLSLAFDWYPVELRARTAAVAQLGRQSVTLLIPLFVGYVAFNYGWRVPFWLVIGPAAVVSLAFLLLKEPVRGYQERKLLGATEEVASHEQAPPSFGESIRIVWSVRVLRRQFYAGLVNGFAGGAFSYLSAFYLADAYHLNALQRGALNTISGGIGIVSLIVFAGVIDLFARFRPQRIMLANGLLGFLHVVGNFGFVLSPNVFFNQAFGIVTNTVGNILQPAQTVVSSLIFPPRARTTALSLSLLVAFPGSAIAQPFAGALADSFGYRNAMLALAPLLLIGVAIQLSAIPFFDYDMRNSRLSAMAGEAYRESVKQGSAKQLVMRKIDVHYGSVQVLFGVDLDLYQGELLALLGTNGGGKSTLLRSITGLSEASAGAILFEGDDITHVPPHEIAKRGVIYMRGGQSGFPSLSVRENLRMGLWMYGRRADERKELERVFAYFPVLRDRLDQVAGTLSGGEQQMVALAQAFLARPKLLLVDELSLGLAPGVVQQLMQIVRDINAAGTSIIIVEQSVTTALKLARRAVFMEKGQIRYDGDAQELLNRTDVLRSVFLAAAAGLKPSGVVSNRRLQQLEDAAPALQVTDVRKNFGGRQVLNGVTFDVREGEILGIIGANGAGKTTLFDVITGFTPQDSGKIVFAGDDVSQLAPDARARLGLIRRFQDARLFPTLTVLETIAIAFERQLEVRNMLMLGLDLPAARRSEANVRRKADDLIEMMGLQAFRDKFVSDLSTGSRRIVDLACSIAAGARLLLLDEPSAGVAQRESEEMVPLLQRVRFHTGCTMLVIDHDMNLVGSVSDELMAMHLGQVMTRGEPRQVLEDPRVIAAYLGQPVEEAAPA